MLSPTSSLVNVRKMVVFGPPTAADNAKPLVPGLTPSEVTVTVAFDGKFVPLSVTVFVNSYTIDAVVTTFTITNKPSLQMPFLGQYYPLSC